jgi:hypothetical protein
VVRVLVRRWWVLWIAYNPDEVLATVDSHTYYFAFSRARAIEKCRRAWTPTPSKWEDA